jgi:4-hydroxyphenylacetate 3-monooxygenase
MSIKNGKQYVDRLDSANLKVWLHGEQVKGKLSEHKAFRGVMATQAGLYDLQGEEAYKSIMTYPSPTSGEPVGLSFLQPKTKEDLTRRSFMMQTWAQRHHGFLGRSPDYMNTILMLYEAAADLLGESNPQFAQNIRSYYAWCRDNDVTLSHAFVQPPITRFSAFIKTMQDTGAARIVEKNKDGIVVHGAFMLATQGATAEEILVFPAPFPSLIEDSPYVFAFAVPSGLPGIKFMCRESFVYEDSLEDYPLSARFEEMDTLVVFDHVLVPWDRIFLYEDEALAYQFIEECNFYPHITHQIVHKNIAKTEFLLGLIECLIEVQGIESYGHIKEKVAEVIIALETLKGMVLNSEMNAYTDRWGSMLPNPRSLFAASAYFPKIYPRFSEIIQLIGGSGLIMIPREKDFQNMETSGDLNLYLKGLNMDAINKVRLFRLAWEVSAGAFGGRQTVYERFYFGDSTKVTDRLYKNYTGREAYNQRVKDFLGIGKEG